MEKESRVSITLGIGMLIISLVGLLVAVSLKPRPTTDWGIFLNDIPLGIGMYIDEDTRLVVNRVDYEEYDLYYIESGYMQIFANTLEGYTLERGSKELIRILIKEDTPTSFINDKWSIKITGGKE